MSEDLKDLAYGIKFDIDDSGLEKVSEKGNIVDSILDKLSSAVEKFQNGLKGTGDSAKKMSDNLNSVNTEGIDKYTQQLELAERKAEILGSQWAKAEEKVHSLNTEYNQAVEMLGSQSDRARKLSEQLDSANMKELRLEEASQKASEQFQKQQELVSKVNDDLAKGVNEENKIADEASKATNQFKNMEGVTSRVKSILAAFGVIGIGFTIANGIKSATTAFVDFQQTMASVHAVLGDVSQKDMNNLSQAALNMSSKYGIAAKDVSSGEETLASAGLNAKEVMQELEPTLLLATAGNIKMDAATADVTSTIKNFGLKAGDATHVVDVFAKSAAATAAEMPDIATAMSYIAPIANSVGWSLEQTSAAIGELSNSGIKGSKAGTTLREIVSRLVYPTGKAADLIKQLGFSAIDPTTHKMKDMTKILTDLSKAMESHGLKNSAEQNAALKLIFGQEAFTGVSALIKAPKQIDDLTKSLQNAKGAGQKYADTMNDTLGKAFDRFKETVTNTFIKDIDKSNLGNSLKNFFNGVTKYVPKFSEDLSFVLNTAMKVAKGIKENFGNIAPALSGVVGAFLAMKTVTSAQNLFAAFSKANMGGFIGFISMAGGIALIAKGFEELKSGNTNLGALLIGTGAGLMAIEKVGLMKSGIIGLVAAGFVELKEGNTNLAGLLFGVAGALAALNIALALTDALSAPILIVVGTIGLAIMLLVTHLDTAKAAFSGFWQGMKQMAQDFLNFFVGIINGFIDKANIAIALADKIPGVNISQIKDLDKFHFAENKGAQGSKQQTAAVKGGGKFHAFASGTNFAPGGLSLVGEKGPELLELPRGSKVTPNDQLHQALNQKATQTFSSITDEYSKQVQQMQPTFNTYGQNLNASLSAGVTNTKQNVSGAVKSTMNVSGNVLNNFAKSSYNYGIGIVSEIGQGVTDSTNNLTSIVKTLTDKVVDAFKTGFGIHSPSKVMYQIGDFLMQGLVNGMSSKDVEGFITKQVGSMTSAAGGAVSGNVAGWLSMALAATGTSMDWLPGLEKLVSAESGGSPTEVNGQAVGGEHATGLLQTLPSTFAAYAVKGLGDILNPVANAAAAINYIKSRYGSVYNTPLFKGGPYMGYANGTRSASPGFHWVGERGPELMSFKGGEQVIPHHESESLFSRPLSSTSKSTHIENKPEIKIIIQESKNPKVTAQEVKKVIEEYIRDLGNTISIETE